MLEITVPYYLGIDGGGTKTTCVVGDEARTLATASAGASNIIRVGETLARESLQRSVLQACSGASVTPSQIVRTCVGAAGAARLEIAAMVRSCLAEIIPTPIDVVADIEIALEAAFSHGPGVVVIAGTGSIAYGREQQGTRLRAGGWGYAIGDEGSAHWIGRSAVNAVLRAADPRDGTGGEAVDLKLESSALAAAIGKIWGVNSFSDLARAANSNPPPDFAALFRVVADSQEPIAVQVLSRAGRELARIATTVARGLLSKNGIDSIPVAMAGGVFRHAPLVRDVFYNELRSSEKRVEIDSRVVDPLEGALRLARRAGTHIG
jgi:glucosamine kinase